MDLEWLRDLKRFPEVERAILAYLKRYPDRAQPWMYLLLAISYQVNGRPPAATNLAIGYAGVLAKKAGDPFTLVEVADIMILTDLNKVEFADGRAPVEAGALLDAAADKAPGRYEPIVLSIILAEKNLDGDRMAAAIERLFRLGWPDVDAIWRDNGRMRARALAKRLEAAGRPVEAAELIRRVEAAEPRDLYIRLTWTGNAGLDLAVTEPLGATASIAEPRTVFGGAIVKSGRGNDPESVYSCPLGFDGDYQVKVNTFYNSNDRPAEAVTLEVFHHEGTDQERLEVHKIILPMTEPIVVKLTGGRRQKVLPYSGETRIKLTVKEFETNPTTGRGTVVPRPDASEAADLLRSRDPKAKPPKSSIQIDPEPAAKPRSPELEGRGRLR